MNKSEFQSQANTQGRMFEDEANLFLEFHGFELLGERTLTEIGCQVDQVAKAPNGQTVYFEFKGVIHTDGNMNQAGMRRTDTVKKGLLTGFLLRSIDDDTPFCIVTSHLPVKGSALTMVTRALECGALTDLFEINSESSVTKLKKLFGNPNPFPL